MSLCTCVVGEGVWGVGPYSRVSLCLCADAWQAAKAGLGRSSYRVVEAGAFGVWRLTCVLFLSSFDAARVGADARMCTGVCARHGGATHTSHAQNESRQPGSCENEPR